MFWSKSVKNNHLYGYRTCWLPSMVHPADWNYSLLHVYFVTFWCILTIMFQFSEYKPLVSLFLRFSYIASFLGPWDRDNFLAICNFFTSQKNWIFMKNCIKNWLKIVKNQFSISFVFWKIKNWIKNCPKSIFLFFYKLLKIEQKWNGCFRTRMHGTRVQNGHSIYNP